MTEKLAYRYVVVLRPTRIRCLLENGNGFECAGLPPSACGNTGNRYSRISACTILDGSISRVCYNPLNPYFRVSLILSDQLISYLKLEKVYAQMVYLSQCSLYLHPDYSTSDFGKFNCSRFPNLNIIVGHLGERIPSDLLRIDTGMFTNNVSPPLMSVVLIVHYIFFSYLFSHDRTSPPNSRIFAPYEKKCYRLLPHKHL